MRTLNWKSYDVRVFMITTTPHFSSYNVVNESGTSTGDNNDMEPQLLLLLLYAVPPFTNLRLQYRTIQTAQVALFIYRKHSSTLWRWLSLIPIPNAPTTNVNITNPDTTANHNTNRFDETVYLVYISTTKLRSQLLSSLISISITSSSYNLTWFAPPQLSSNVNNATTFQIVIPDRL
jgi:hypothetical protein